MWLGLSKVNAKAEFQWVNGTTLDGYTNWSPGEPNNADGHELCTEMLVTGNYRWNKWNDVKCITDYKSITVCEKPLREGDWNKAETHLSLVGSPNTSQSSFKFL